MKAIQYSEHGGPEVLTYVDITDPKPGPGEVLVRVKAASVNHLDIHIRNGIPGFKIPLPHIPGCDAAGIVEAVGMGVQRVHVGDRVVMNPALSCERCERCYSGEISMCHKYQIIGEHRPGAHAELVTIPEKNAIHLPNDVSFETAAAACLVYLTAWSMVVSKARIQPGDSVLVMGAASGVGTAAIQIAKMMGAKVFSTAGTPEKAKMAREKLNLDDVILYKETPVDVAIRRLTNKRGVDVVIDHVGGEQWAPILRATRNGGTIVTCGATAGHDPKEDLRQVFYRQLRILGSTMGNHAELLKVLGFVFRGELKPFIDATYKLSEAQKAHRRIEDRDVFGKIVLQP